MGVKVDNLDTGVTESNSSQGNWDSAAFLSSYNPTLGALALPFVNVAPTVEGSVWAAPSSSSSYVWSWAAYMGPYSAPASGSFEEFAYNRILSLYPADGTVMPAGSPFEVITGPVAPSAVVQALASAVSDWNFGHDNSSVRTITSFGLNRRNPGQMGPYNRDPISYAMQVLATAIGLVSRTDSAGMQVTGATITFQVNSGPANLAPLLTKVASKQGALSMANKVSFNLNPNGAIAKEAADPNFVKTLQANISKAAALSPSAKAPAPIASDAPSPSDVLQQVAPYAPVGGGAAGALAGFLIGGPIGALVGALVGAGGGELLKKKETGSY